MSGSSCRKNVSISRCLLIFLALNVLGCGIDSKYVFLYIFPISGLPIAGFPSIDTFAWRRMGGELITGPLRMFCSIVVYAILLSALATIPLYIKKSFENKVLFKYYVLYWLVASLIFATLFLLLLGIVPNMPSYYSTNIEYIYFMLALCTDILLPPMLPALYQHYKKRKND